MARPAVVRRWRRDTGAGSSKVLSCRSALIRSLKSCQLRSNKSGMLLRLLLGSALSFTAELQSLFTWDTAARSTLIFFDPSRSTKTAGPVKISFFGGIGFGRVRDPLKTRDGVLLVASLADLMATKLKATLDRAEAKDYRDIAAMISAGVSLSIGLSAFRQMFNGEPAQVLRAIGYFKDGDLNTLSQSDQQVLRSARDGVDALPDVLLKSRSLATPLNEDS